MDFDRLFALAIAAFCLMMIASFVGLVAWSAGATMTAVSTGSQRPWSRLVFGLVIYAFSDALIG